MISYIDSHAAGEPLRVITNGFPPIKGNTMLEKRKQVKQSYDGVRKMLMLEPRGHSGMYGCILTEAVTKDGDFGVLFTHNEGLSTMCGHGIIAVTKVALQVGMITCKEGLNKIAIDSPAGRITAYAEVTNNRIGQIRFINVPSFVYNENIRVDVGGCGEINADIAFGGAFYVYVNASEMKKELTLQNIEYFVKKGMEIKHKVMDQYSVVHPEEPGLNSIYGTIFMDKVTYAGDKAISKNLCIFADGQIDRSPTGTGTAGRVALMKAKGQLEAGMTLYNKSIIDTIFTGKVVEDTTVGSMKAIIPEIGGDAYIMGFGQMVLDEEDPLPEGFRVIGG